MEEGDAVSVGLILLLPVLEAGPFPSGVDDHVALEDAHKVPRLPIHGHADLSRPATKLVIHLHGQDGRGALLIRRRLPSLPDVDDVQGLAVLLVRVLDDVRVAREELADETLVHLGHLEALDAPNLRQTVVRDRAADGDALEGVPEAREQAAKLVGDGAATRRHRHVAARRHREVLGRCRLVPRAEVGLEGGRLCAFHDLGELRARWPASRQAVVVRDLHASLALVGRAPLANPHEDLRHVVHDEHVLGGQHALRQDLLAHHRLLHLAARVRHLDELELTLGNSADLVGGGRRNGALAAQRRPELRRLRPLLARLDGRLAAALVAIDGLANFERLDLLLLVRL